MMPVERLFELDGFYNPFAPKYNNNNEDELLSVYLCAVLCHIIVYCTDCGETPYKLFY